MEILLIIAFATLLIIVALQSRRIRSYMDAVEDLQSTLRARLSNAQFESKGMASDDVLIQDIQETIELVDDIFDDV